MATKKSIQFAAPYSSKTFKRAQEILVGTSGVVSGGKVSSQNGVVTVQPLMFVQNGLFVTTDYVMTVVIPGSLSAPYSLAVSTPTSIESPQEVLVPTFVKRPQDVSLETVIIADWDGIEWIHRPHLQIAELVREQQKSHVDRDLIGIYKGFDVGTQPETVLVEGGSRLKHRLTVSPGALVNREGALVVKEVAAEFVTAPQDRAFNRTDTLVFRQPKSPLLGPGQLQILLGDTYRDDGAFLADEAVTLQIEDKQTTVIKQTGLTPLSVAVAYISDYGARADLRCRITRDGIESADFSVALGVVGCDFIFNQADNRLEFVYTTGNSLHYKSTALDGTVVYQETLIAAESSQVHAPKLVSTQSGALSFFHVFYELHVGTTDKRLKYTRISSLNTKELETPATLISLGVALSDFAVIAASSDMIAHVAYKNASTGRAYLRSYDLGVFVTGGAPKEEAAPVELQDDAYSPALGTTVEGQSVGQIHLVDDGSEEPYVLWKHVEGESSTLVGVYHKSFKTRFGHKTLVFDLAAALECDEFHSFSAVKTPIGDLLLTAVCLISGTPHHRNVKIDLADMSMGGLLSSTPVLEASDPKSLIDPTGGLSVAFGGQSAAAANNGVATSVVFFGPGTFGDQLITEREFVLACSTGNNLSPGYEELPKSPTHPDLIVVSSAATTANNGTVTWIAERTITVEGIRYKVIQTSKTFQAEQPETARAQFQYLTGTPAHTYRINTGDPTNLRGFRVPHTDVFIANIRASDGKLAASGVAIEENLPIARLYEFFNCFAGGGGTVSWEEAGLSNKLKFTQPLAINFYNRTSTYTIPATSSSGVTLLQNQVLYVQIPDEDTSTTLEVKVANFGEGVLDRYGKNVYPLFWNTQGTLYTRFAPFRLASGEVIQIGDQVSRQLLDWLGAPSSTPNRLEHGYSSTLRIEQSDSIVEAISHLDEGIEAVRGELTDYTLSVAEDLYAYMSQCRLVADSGTRLQILSSDRILPTGEKLTRPLSAMKLSFEGALIDFTLGKVFASDGVTSIGLDFTPAQIPNGHYQWFSISLVPYLINTTTNEMSAQVLIIPASSTSPVASLAPRAAYPSTGMSLGMVRLQGTASGIVPITQSALEIIAVGGGTGTGSGGGSSEIGTPISPADGFKAVVYDHFTESSDGSDSSVSAAQTTASYVTASLQYRILCDRTKNATTSGAAFTLNSAPSFQLKVGDILFSNAQSAFRRITALSSQTEGTLDGAFNSPLSASPVFLSQAVTTKNLVSLGDAEEKSRLQDTFPGQSIDRISISYEDSLAEGDTVSDFNSAARIVVSASAVNQSTPPSSEYFTAPFTRPTGPLAIEDYPLSASGQGLFLTFFANPNNSEVVSGANLLSYEASLYTEELLHSGWSLDSGFRSELGDEIGLLTESAFLEASPSLSLMISAGSVNATILSGSAVAVQSWAGALSGFEVYGSGIAPGTSVFNLNEGTLTLSAPALNTSITVVQFRKAVTKVVLSFDYVPGIRPESLEGDLEVIVGGKPIPRQSSAFVGRHYKEIAGSTDEILLSFALTPFEEITVRRRQGTIDTSSVNSTKLHLLNTAIVGTELQIEAGVATHASIQAAHDTVTGAGKIVVLPGTYDESVVWTRDDLVLEGRGRLTVIDGDFLLSGHGNDISGLKVLGDLTLTGSDYNFVKMWLGSQSVFTPGGQFNLLSIIQE